MKTDVNALSEEELAISMMGVAVELGHVAASFLDFLSTRDYEHLRALVETLNTIQ